MRGMIRIYWTMAGIKSKMHKIETIGADQPIKDASHILDNNLPNALLAVEDDRIVGIVTDSDILIKVDKNEIGSESIKIKEVMSSPVITIESNKGIKEAIDLMVINDIEKLVVLENGIPIGVLYGEEILELEEEKLKEVILHKTIIDVFKILLKEPDSDPVSVLNTITEIGKFSNMESKVEFDLFVYQEGLVSVAYNYIKDNSDKKLDDIIEDIKENYDRLLEKYSEDE